jgi:hypothetical protein
MVIRLLPQSWVTLTFCNHETKQYRVVGIQCIVFHNNVWNTTTMDFEVFDQPHHVGKSLICHPENVRS